MIKRNVDLDTPLSLSPWRKISIGSWKIVGDSSVYGLFEINVDEIQKLIKKFNEKNNQKLTITHVIGKALAMAVNKNPDINSIVRWGKIYPRKSVDVFFHIAVDGDGKDLSGCVVREADKKSIPEILISISDRVKSLKAGDDKDYKKIKSLFNILPGVLLKPFVDLTGILLYRLNLWSPSMGVARDSFGSFMITNIGSIGLPLAIVPLPAYAHLPMIFCIGGIEEKPIASNGTVIIAPMLKCSLTFDHRLIDGVHAAKLYNSFLTYLGDINSLKKELNII